MEKKPQKKGSVILNLVALCGLVVLFVSLIGHVWTQNEIITKISMTSFLVVAFSTILYWFIYYEEEKED